MATKNISRTIIEGGRRPFNKGERRGRAAQFRAAERTFVRRACRDPLAFDARVEPVRTRVAKDFDDKLGPARRWLRRQTGRLWDDVYSEIRARFDTRTTAGRHIVFDHMLGWVERDEIVSRFHWTEFFVDDEGILRVIPRRPRRRRDPPGTVRRRTAEIVEWAAGRKVAVRGTVLFWFVPAVWGEAVSYRQHRRLDEREITFFRSLTPDARELVAKP